MQYASLMIGLGGSHFHDFHVALGIDEGGTKLLLCLQWEQLLLQLLSHFGVPPHLTPGGHQDPLCQLDCGGKQDYFQLFCSSHIPHGSTLVLGVREIHRNWSDLQYICKWGSCSTLGAIADGCQNTHQQGHTLNKKNYWDIFVRALHQIQHSTSSYSHRG